MEKGTMKALVFLVLFSLTPPLMGSGGGQKYPALLTSAAELEQWRGQRFGMFIHWGPVSQTGYEISWSRGSQIPTADYDQLYTTFDPIYFNAQEWVGVAKAAGMKYLVITTRHHDGFCLFDSAYTTYDMMSTPFGRDVCAELSAECAAQGIDFCAYLSVPDWWYDDDPLDSYLPYLHNLAVEVITKYDPKIMWFDNWEGAVTNYTIDHGCDLYKLCRDTKDNMLVTDRVYAAYLDTSLAQYPGDYNTPEQTIGAFDTTFPWESCITIGTQWAWKPNDTIKSLKECIQTLVRCAGGDGNLLLNIGPKGDGSIESLQVSRLQEMGQWINSNSNGTAIYNTRGGPADPQLWGVTTHNQNTVYAHIWGENWLGSHGTAAQSSTWGSGYEAYRSVDSQLSTFGHNAQGDATPTWQIKTDGYYDLTKVELINRMGFEYRATDYVVEFLDFTGDVSTQFGLGTGGTVLYRTETLNPGGADGSPGMFTIDLVERTGGSLTCNFIRVVKTAGTENYLHMAEVQAYATNQPGMGQQITIPQMGGYTAQSAYLLANPATSVPFTQDGDYVTLNLSSIPADPIDTIVALSIATGGDTTPPAAPANLSATGGDSTVSLNWNDNTEPDLASYNVYRSTTSGSGYSSIATGVANSAYTDNSVTNDTTYYYVVTAVDTSSNESDNSNEVSAMPQSGGSQTVYDYANTDLFVSGTASGSYLDTQASDNVYESITETESGGKPQSRYTYLEHKWTIHVTGGNTVIFYVEAHHTSNSENDNFVFAYSTNDSSYTDMLTVTKTSDDGTYQSYNLPNTLSGTVYIRVRDTDRTSGHRNLDTIYIDRMYIESTGSSGGDITPPAAPANLAATAGDATVLLDWVDNSEPDLAGYNVYRSTTSGSGYSAIAAGVGGSAYTDNTVTNGTTYYYVVTAVDTSSNESADSNEAATTPSGGSCTPADLHVESIICSAEDAGAGYKRGVATVSIYDDCGSPVANATVTGTFSGSFSEQKSAVTDANGTVVLKTTGTKRGGVSFTFCVDGVSHTSLPYDASDNMETCDSY